MCEPGTPSTLDVMRETLEREIKLAPGRASSSPSSAASGCRRGSSSPPTTTPQDLRLARHGVTFRHRVEDGAGLWQLKLPRGAARLELELPGRRRGLRPSSSPCCPPTSAAARSFPSPGCARAGRAIRARGAEIVDDSVAVLEGQRVARRFREVEVELLDGDERTLRRLEKELRKAGARATGDAAAEALPRARPGRRHRAPGRARRGRRRARRSAIALEAEYRALLAHDPGTRRGDDPEDLHQLRVATRRLRAFLRAARPLVDGDWAESLREELGWLGGHLGPARDLDVMLDRLRAEVAALGDDAEAAAGLLEALEEERAAAYRDVVETLGGDRYFALLDRLEAAAAPPLTGDETTARDDLPPGGEADAADVRGARRRSRGRCAARVADRGQARALRGGSRRPRARPAGRAVRRRREAAAGHPRRPPGRRRRAGADPGLGGVASRPGERVRRRAGSSSSSATGWPRPARRGPTRGSGSTRPRGGRSAEHVVRAAGGSSSGAPGPRPRCSSSIGRPTTTGRSRRGRSSPARATRSAPCARSRRRRGCAARSGGSCVDRRTTTRRGGRSGCATG